MQNDNHLVLYGASGAIWSTGVYDAGHGKAFAIMQNDGNFVEYDGKSRPMWATGTSGGQKAPDDAWGKGHRLMLNGTN